MAVVLALASLRLRGLGLALMTIAAALFFDNSVFTQNYISNGLSLSVQAKWIGLGIFNPNGHSLFILEVVVLVVCTVGVLLVRKGTVGQYLSAMRGSETAAAGLGINLTWNRILIFALSGVVAGLGGTMSIIQSGTVNASQFNYQISLAFVVIVITTGVSTVEGAINAGFALVVIEQLLTYLPSRFGGEQLVFVLFAAGALQYANHPEGILEFQKRKWTLFFEERLFGTRMRHRLLGLRPVEASSARPIRRPWPEGRPPVPPESRVVERRDYPLRLHRHTRVVAGSQAAAGRGRRLQVVRRDCRRQPHDPHHRGRGERGTEWPQRGGQDHAVQLHLRPARPEEGTVVLAGDTIGHLPVYQRARLGIGRPTSGSSLPRHERT